MQITLKKEKEKIEIHTPCVNVKDKKIFFLELTSEEAIQLGKMLIDLATSENIQELSLTLNNKGEKECHSET